MRTTLGGLNNVMIFFSGAYNDILNSNEILCKSHQARVAFTTLMCPICGVSIFLVGFYSTPSIGNATCTTCIGREVEFIINLGQLK